MSPPFRTQHILNCFGEMVMEVSSLIGYIVPLESFSVSVMFPPGLCRGQSVSVSVYQLQYVSVFPPCSSFWKNVVSWADLIALASRWSWQRLNHVLSGPLLLPFVLFDLNWSFRLSHFFFFFFFYNRPHKHFYSYSSNKAGGGCLDATIEPLGSSRAVYLFTEGVYAVVLGGIQRPELQTAFSFGFGLPLLRLSACKENTQNSALSYFYWKTASWDASCDIQAQYSQATEWNWWILSCLEVFIQKQTLLV